MQKLNLQPEDVIEYWNNCRQTSEQRKTDAAKKSVVTQHFMPFRNKNIRERMRILYTDGSISQTRLPNRTIWGISFDGWGIRLRESSKPEEWEKACQLCGIYFCGNHSCTAGDRYFWSAMGMLTRHEIAQISDFLVSLGGDPLTGIYWTAVTAGDGAERAWVYCITPDKYCISPGLDYGNLKSRLRKYRAIVKVD